MPGYFFDSSALVKRYHFELGSSAVQQIVTRPGSAIRISRLAVSELISAFAIEVRTQTIRRDDALAFQHQLRNDIAAGTLEVYSIGEGTFSLAERLLERHAFDLRLRALDALQLAAAIELRTGGLVDYFVCADKTLCSVAAQEGFQAINPEET